jgi:hypothetical protein
MVRCLLLCALLFACLPAFAAEWTQPTPEELKMTSDPAAPGAAAVYLYREEIVDDTQHYHLVYARIKILTEKGKEEFADQVLPYEKGVSNIWELEGRTIHSDGTVVPSTGKPYDKELVKRGDEKIMAKVFSMPDVQVGSILEFRWRESYDEKYFEPPHFYLQQPVFVHKAHYHFVPFKMNESSTVVETTDAMGHELAAETLLYLQELPPGAKVRETASGYDLMVENIPPVPDEPYSPPMDSFAYRLFFYYSSALSGQEFWRQEGKFWSKDVDRFAKVSDKIEAAVAQIVAPGDSDLVKLQKIYAAVMTVENTRFTREHSAAENTAEGLRVKTADDIWGQKRGSDDEINRLFLAMARAARLKAYDMIVPERNRNILNLGYLYWGQLEDEISIVEVGGKEMYFDPGQRYCEFGKLAWIHSGMLGIRQTAKGTEMATSAGLSYQDNVTMRDAALELGTDGTLKGQLRITMSGAEALRWRQLALRTDEQEAKKDFEEAIQARVPDGVHVKMGHFLDLTDSASVLMAVLDVSGNMGTATGKRVFLPSSFFEADVKPLFVDTKRENPVDLRFPYTDQDAVNVDLAPGLKVESVPNAAKILLPQFAEYVSNYAGSGNTYEEERTLAVATELYHKQEYPQLLGFLEKTGAQDQEQVVLDRAPVVASAKGQ